MATLRTTNSSNRLMISYRLQLRQATHDYHVRLNRHPFLKDLTKPVYPLAHYKALLLVYLHVYRSIEEVIERFMLSNDVDFDYSEREKLSALTRDIDYFKLDNFNFDLSKISRSTVLKIDNISQFAGLLYVIEGSTLGGQHISQALSDFHGITSDNGACFFNGYGEQTLKRWEIFLEFFDSVIQDKVSFEMAKDTACHTFQIFQSALDCCLPILSD